MEGVEDGGDGGREEGGVEGDEKYAEGGGEEGEILTETGWVGWWWWWWCCWGGEDIVGFVIVWFF